MKTTSRSCLTGSDSYFIRNYNEGDEMESPHVVCLACDMNSCGLTCIWLITTYSDDQEKEPFHVVSIIVDQELL